VDVTELPGCQNADEKQYGNTNPHGQRTRHFLASGFAIGIVLHHEEKGGAKAANDGDKRKND
jgi:hypothetical protein